jgi:hypothetical protein
MGEGVNACVRERETMEGGGVGGQGESPRQEFARGRSRHFAFYPVISQLSRILCRHRTLSLNPVRLIW